ncbi:MAG: OsmC family protein [Chlorobium sp.]|uniref:OsmC family protein n=1 Tax=Chlorobium sp. TaxID=1095 RepID=UPI002F3E2978
MQVNVSYKESMPLRGTNGAGHITLFDTSPQYHGTGSAPSPMEVMLESLAACSMMDIIGILNKKRREVGELAAHIDAERAEEHPKVFTAVRIMYRLKSSDCTMTDFERSIELSMEKYCSVSAMLRASGCRLEWSAELVHNERTERTIS